MTSRNPSQVARSVPRPSLLSTVAPHLLFVGVALLAAVVVTWPLALHPATKVPGNLGDPLENAWIFGWAAHAVIDGGTTVFDGNMFFPDQNTLAFAENMVGVSLPVAPIFWLSGNSLLMVAVASILVLASSGYGTMLVVRHLGGTRIVALLGGVAYVIAPYRVAQVGHVHVIATHVLPFVLLTLFSLARAPRVRTAIAFALLVALQWWSSLTGGILTLVAVGSWCLAVLVVRRKESLRPLLAAAAGMAVAAVLIIPLAVPYLRAREAYPESYAHPEIEVISNSATPGSYLFAPRRSSVTHAIDGRLFDRFANEDRSPEKTIFPGLWLVMGAAATAIWVVAHSVRRRGRWVTTSARAIPALTLTMMGLSGFALTLGPRWGASPGGAPLPFALVSALVPGSLTRVPPRFASLVILSLAIAVATAADRLRSGRRLVVLVASIALLALETFPGSVTTVRAPDLTAGAKRVPERARAAIAFPTAEFDEQGNLLFESLPREAQHLYRSMAHFRPLTNGYGALLPQRYTEIVEGVQGFPSPTSIELLRDRGVDTVIVEESLVVGTRWADIRARMRNYPELRLVASGEGTFVYSIAPATLSNVPR